MMHSIPRALAAALFGALAGPACVILGYALNPATTFSVDRLPPITSGLYKAERDGVHPFVWTSRQGVITLDGLDRRTPWSCVVHFRGARGPAIPQPDLVLAIDGVSRASKRATNEFQDIEAIAPERPLKPGLVLTMTSSQTFVPGGGDPRELGVQVDYVGCRPVRAAVVFPPRRSLGTSALSGALLGAAFGLTGITAGSAIGAAVLMAAAQAVPLTHGGALYSRYPSTMVWLAAWIALLLPLAVRAVEAINRQPLRNTARFAIAFSAAAVYLKLLGLLHPAKTIVDALFHAHRFDAVLAGRFYFTQLSGSATPFPYAIGLYLFAAPWSLVTHNHVALLRIVVIACEAITGALLYLMIVRTRGDRLAGAVAVALYSLVPLSYEIIGNANLTHAFGQSVALATIAAVTIWPLEPKHVARFTIVVLLATLGFISHVSAFMLLFVALLAVAFFYRAMGGQALLGPARSVALATTIGLVLSVVLYWGHFGDLYKARLAHLGDASPSTLAETRSPATVKAAAVDGGSGEPVLGREPVSLGRRVSDAASQTVRNFGWPILVLAVAGLWPLVRGGRDRLVFALAAWSVVWLAFVGFSVLTPADKGYQRDAWEFIGRIEHITSPAAVILAAIGATWAWRAGRVARVAATVLMIAAVAAGVRAWVGWL